MTLTQEVIALDTQIEVTAEAVGSAEAGLLKIQQKSDKVTDGISTELISKTSSSDTGDALKRVTGVTMVGKYTYVHGLGGRYGNTLLNGAKIETRTTTGDTPLQTAKTFGHHELAQLLIARGAVSDNEENSDSTATNNNEEKKRSDKG